ncbi:hypothetical protein QJS66_17820 [Kocuria rhizophila]|nr:hypothetical protein QJS66_17820 [Kocuria rhizophila]
MERLRQEVRRRLPCGQQHLHGIADGEFLVLVAPRAAASPRCCAWSWASRTSPAGT